MKEFPMVQPDYESEAWPADTALERPLIPLAEYEAHMNSLVLDADKKTVMPEWYYVLVLKSSKSPEYLQASATHSGQRDFATRFRGSWIRANKQILTKYNAFLAGDRKNVPTGLLPVADYLGA